MVTNELLNAVKNQLALGKEPSIIKNNLMSQGFNETDITQAFAQLGVIISGSPSGFTSTVPTTPIQQAKSTSFLDFRNLKWYEGIALIPAMFLMFSGGLLGLGMGLLGWTLTLKVMRNTSYSVTFKIFLVIVITIGYLLLSLILAGFIVGFIEGFVAGLAGY